MDAPPTTMRRAKARTAHRTERGNVTANLPTLNINRDRIDADLKHIAEFTDPALPYTRRAFSPYYEAAREWLAGRFRDAGLDTRVDPAGNLIGRRGDGAGPVLMLGSHIDTVESGGRFDGIVGVLGALEVVRCLRESGITLSRPLEVVDFVCEEPSVVNLSPLGSRIMAGDVTADMVAEATTPDGGTLPDAIARLGGDSSRLDESQRRPGDIYGYLELHIEQGPVLERAGMEVGVVTIVAAPCRAVVTLTGVADHAGATAMPDRRDALAGAAELTLAVERIVSTPDIMQESVGTVGFLRIGPNMVNVIPGRADLTVEVRSTQTEALLWAREEIERSLREIADRRGLGATLEWQHLEEPVPIPLGMQEVVAESAESLRLRTLRLPSRASHDAARLAPIAPVGMVFIPCRDGRSHCPEEWAELDDIVTGTQVLGGALLRLDAQS